MRRFASQDVDFGKYLTYDFIITSNDPLEDEIILQQFVDSSPGFKGMVRDKKSPDICITLAKNADQSVNTTYVPPTSQVVTKGSVTTPVYNYITHKHDWLTKVQNTVSRTDGFTKTTKTSDLFLEISVLDAKRMASKEQVSPPIIWQMKYSKTFTDTKHQLSDLYVAVASHCNYPMTKQKVVSVAYLKSPINYVFDESNVVVKVPETEPQKQKDFLQIGDKVLEIDGKKELQITYSLVFKDGTIGERLKSKTKLSEKAGLTSAINRYMKNLDLVYNYSSEGSEEIVGVSNVSCNFNNQRTFTILRNGKKMKVIGVLLSVNDIPKLQYWDDISKVSDSFEVSREILPIAE